ncbi:DUF11 domain-containing protein [Leucobacter luti]|nr:DUF11 domain-containing protein [Leucobacter luti]
MVGVGLALALLGGLAVPFGGLAAAPAAGLVSDPAPNAESEGAAPQTVPPAGSSDAGAPSATPAPDTDPAATAADPDTSPADPATPAETDAEESDGAALAEEAAPVQVAPRSVPVAPAGSAVLNVRVGGDRLASGTVKGLPGVQLGLYATGTASVAGAGSTMPTQGAQGTRLNASWGWTTCVSDADGDCNFTIPIRAGAASATGAPQDTRFWVVQEVAPAGWYANPTLRVGPFGATPETSWQYRFRTDTQLRAGQTYSSTTPMAWNPLPAPALPTDTPEANPDRGFMRNRLDNSAEGNFSSNVTRSTGVWNQSRNNPALLEKCGIDIALIADTSGSLGATGIADMKSAMTNFVNAFIGTNTNMSLFSFSNLSPGSGASNHPALLPVTTTAEATTFKDQYADWLSGGGTNWDRGFAAAANATSHYDLAILITDGNPTVIRDNSVSTSSAYNSLQDVDGGIFSANQLKAEGTRVVALGVGPALTAASDANLRAVSGPVSNSDYYRTSNFAEATAALVALATKSCNGTIGVQKMIVPAGGTIADATPAPAGWRFDASTTASTMTLQAPLTRTTVTGDGGLINYELGFTAPATAGPVQILETQQPGYEIVPVGTGAAARNATCVNTQTGAAAAVTNAGTAEQPGFTVQGLRSERVLCTIYNRALAPGKLEVSKSSDPATGATVRPGQSITYTLTFRNTGEQPVAVNHDDVLTDVLDDATLTGAITAQSPLAAALTSAGDRIRITGSLPAGATRTVSYAVTVKDPLPANANASLRNVVVPTGEQPPSTCEPNTPCTVHPVRGSLSWNKVSASGARLSGSEWSLTPLDANGQPQAGAAVAVVDCVAATASACTGADRDPAAGAFALSDLAIGTYQLRETRAPAGYQLLTDPITITVNTAVAYGNITNRQIEVPGIPLTGGMGSLGFLLTAGGLGATAAAGVWLQRRRRQGE